MASFVKCPVAIEWVEVWLVSAAYRVRVYDSATAARVAGVSRAGLHKSCHAVNKIVNGRRYWNAGLVDEWAKNRKRAKQERCQ